MAWGTYDATVPPTLLTGGVVQFDSARALAALIDPELSHHRLLCIDLADLADLIGRPSRLPRFLQESRAGADPDAPDD